MYVSGVTSFNSTWAASHTRWRLCRPLSATAAPSLLIARFGLLRSKGSHRIYGLGRLWVTVPFHSGEILHPRIVRQVLEVMEEAAHASASDETL
ncbi:MAG: type II toxin-antitoxin system HicA family toxin [Bryobacteraceae bacterium]